MDFIQKYDIELDKEHYKAGELINGWVTLETTENLKVSSIQVFLRGRAHVEWRVTRGGERRTVKEDQYFVDETVSVWGLKDPNQEEPGSAKVLFKGDHRLPFEFQLPRVSLPCSFESRVGTVRYYLRVIIDIPYASPPQGLKYFTVIGPSIDCFDDQYTTPLYGSKQLTGNCLQCCRSGPISLEACLERMAYCCCEKLKLKCEVQNGSDREVSLFCQLYQIVQFKINKSETLITKEIRHVIMEHSSQAVRPHSSKNFNDLCEDLQLPVVPPTLTNVCRIIEIKYILSVGLAGEKLSDDLSIDFPVIITSVPHRTINNDIPELTYRPADSHVEGGIYISPEFQLGQVYDGGLMDPGLDLSSDREPLILYRPVYLCIVRQNSGESTIKSKAKQNSSDRLVESTKLIS